MPVVPTWLSGWSYRKSHTVLHAADAGTLYQVKITVHAGVGCDSGGDVYLNNHGSRSDFGDVRFTASDKSTLLNYWQDPTLLVAGTSSVFWVQVSADLTSVDQTIYIYYYNLSICGTTSNGATTFPDGFLSGASPKELGDLWAATSENSAVNYINGSQLDITVGAAVGQTGGGKSSVFDAKMLNAFNQMSTYVGGCAEVHFGSISGHNVEIDLYYYTQTLNALGGYWASFVYVAFKFADGTYWIVRMATSDNPKCRDNSIITVAPSSTGVTITCPTNVTELGDGTGSWLTKAISCLTYYSSSTVTDVYVGVSGGFDNNTGYGSVEAYFQNIRARKIVSPEPVNSVWGPEETPVTTNTRTYSIDYDTQKLGVTKTGDLDVALQEQDIPITYATDVALKKLDLSTGSFVDVIFESGLKIMVPVDVALQKQDLTLTASIDSVLQKLDITVEDSIGVIFTKLDIPITYFIDAVLEKLGISVTDSIDVMLRKLGIQITDSIDTIFKKLGITVTYLVDMDALKTIHDGCIIDAQLKLEAGYHTCPRCGRHVRTLVHINNVDFCGYEYICFICYMQVTNNGTYVPCP